MEYGLTVWDPYKTHSDTLEKVQRRAVRWVMGRFDNMSSPSARIQDLGWRDLNQRSVNSRLCMLYKISQGLLGIPIGQFLKYNRNGVHFQTIYMPEPSTMSFSPVLLLLGTNFLATLFWLKIWQCSNRSLPPLIMLCPGLTNHCLTPTFILHCYKLFIFIFIFSFPL